MQVLLFPLIFPEIWRMEVANPQEQKKRPANLAYDRLYFVAFNLLHHQLQSQML